MNRFLRLVHLLAFAALSACASSSGGGPVGTGISSIEGNVVSVETDAVRFQPSGFPPIPPVTVQIDEFPDLQTETDEDGEFAVMGEFSGPLTVAFARGGRRLASLQLDVPAGSTVVIENIELRPSLPGGIRTDRIRQRDFFGRVFMIDCNAGVLLVNDEARGRHQFLARLSGETIIRRPDGALLSCAQLRRGMEVLVEGAVRSDRTIDAATVVVKPPRPPLRR